MTWEKPHEVPLDEFVLAVDKSGTYWIAKADEDFAGGLWWMSDEGRMVEPVAWMPLPELPEGVQS